MSRTDVAVVLPGIMGSTLHKDGTLVWAPSAGALLRAIRTFGDSIASLRLPQGIGDDHPGDRVEAVDLMPDVHAIPGLWTPVRGYGQLVARLRATGFHDTADQPGNLLLFPYDWRLSNRYNAHRLAGLAEDTLTRWRAQGGSYADARLIFVCHSMGGLIARWYVEKLGGADHTRAVITFGTPYRGSAKALDQLANGLHAERLRLPDTFSRFAASLPSLHQLLPDYACIDGAGGLLKISETTIPGLDAELTADAARFQTDLHAAEAARPASLAMTHTIAGVNQPTVTTARVTQGRVEMLETIGADNEYGDSTVPLTGAIGHDQQLDTNTVHRIADKHGNLHRNRGALEHLESIITSKPVTRRAPAGAPLRVDAPDYLAAGDDLPVDVLLEGDRHALRITLTDERGRTVSRTPRLPADGHMRTSFTELAPGPYTLDVTGLHQSAPIAPVSSDILVWESPTHPT